MAPGTVVAFGVLRAIDHDQDVAVQQCSKMARTRRRQQVGPRDCCIRAGQDVLPGVVTLIAPANMAKDTPGWAPSCKALPKLAHVRLSHARGQMPPSCMCTHTCNAIQSRRGFICASRCLCARSCGQPQHQGRAMQVNAARLAAKP